MVEMETIYTPQGDGNYDGAHQSCKCQETIYTPQGDGNQNAVNQLKIILPKKSTPRKGTETLPFMRT